MKLQWYLWKLFLCIYYVFNVKTDDSLQWVESTGPVYVLPESLRPEVFPWLAIHIWYYKKIDQPSALQNYVNKLYKSEEAKNAATQEIATMKSRWMENYNNFLLTNVSEFRFEISLYSQ